jgi:hypothetical protein
MSRRERLAAALLKDRERRTQKTKRPRAAPVDDFDPFEATRWRTIAGGDPGYLVKTSMRRGPVGWFINCCNCGDEFESKGWKYCPTCMELPAEKRRQDAWKRAQDCGLSERPCEAPGCDNSIPMRARADARYCSETCAKRAQNARRQSSTAPPILSTPTHEIPQQNQGPISSLFGHADFPTNLISGDRRGRRLPSDLAKIIVKTECGI